MICSYVDLVHCDQRESERTQLSMEEAIKNPDFVITDWSKMDAPGQLLIGFQVRILIDRSVTRRSFSLSLCDQSSRTGHPCLRRAAQALPASLERTGRSRRPEDCRSNQLTGQAGSMSLFVTVHVNDLFCVCVCVCLRGT